MTVTDFERFPDVPGKQALLDGKLIVSPPPKDSHTQIAALVYESFRKYPDASRVRVVRGFDAYQSTLGRWCPARE